MAKRKFEIQSKFSIKCMLMLTTNNLNFISFIPVDFDFGAFTLKAQSENEKWQTLT